MPEFNLTIEITIVTLAYVMSQKIDTQSHWTTSIANACIIFNTSFSVSMISWLTCTKVWSLCVGTIRTFIASMGIKLLLNVKKFVCFTHVGTILKGRFGPIGQSGRAHGLRTENSSKSLYSCLVHTVCNDRIWIGRIWCNFYQILPMYHTLCMDAKTFLFQHRALHSSMSWQELDPATDPTALCSTSHPMSQWQM